jgi:hypothetical protein
MIWRGKQYVHAIKLYYRKNGRFPTTIDDLFKPKVGALRFLRQEYKDPMNKEDGSWRLIYVGHAGQLIGSLKPPQNIQFQGPGGGAQPGTPAGGPSSGFGGFGSTPSAGSNPQQGAFGSQIGGTSAGASGTTPPGTAGTGATDNGTTPNGAPAPVDTSTFVGGNIIGIGSKVDKSSFGIYEKATNYHLFEFIWDPSKDAMTIGGAGTQVGTPGAPGQQGPNQGNQGFGQGFGQGQQGTSGQPAPSSQPGGNPGPAPQMPPLSPNAPPP